MSHTDTGVRTLDPPLPPALFEYLINPLVTLILRSPLHGLISDSLLLVTVTGRKSGTEYTTPVAYEERDRTLYVTSLSEHAWWRNLRGGAPVTVRLRGERLEGTADVVEDDEEVADYVREFVDRHGIDSLQQIAVAVDGEELPDRETLAAGLGRTVLVRIDLEGA